MRTGETDLEKERLFLGMIFDPPLGQLSDEVVGLGFRRQIPGEGTEFFRVVSPLPIELPLLFDEATRRQRCRGDHMPALRLDQFGHIALQGAHQRLPFFARQQATEVRSHALYEWQRSTVGYLT